MRLIRRRGQFLILTAFLVMIILSSGVVTAFKRLQDNPLDKTVKVAETIVDINNSLTKLLGFTVGYYGSIIQITGNITYAKEKTSHYLMSGLETVSLSDMRKGISFNLHDLSLSANWYEKIGYTTGQLQISYSVPTLGLSDVKFTGESMLLVDIIETNGGVCNVRVIGNQNKPNLSLSKENFQFFKYDRYTRRWSHIQIDQDPYVSINGTYEVVIPSGINQDTYFLQVIDQNGIMAVSGYIRGIGNLNKQIASYEYELTWDPLYNSINRQPIAMEILQNGVVRWLGEEIDAGGVTKPIPPIPVKNIRVNQTIGGVNQLTPFQIESWASDFQVPFGETSNSTIFNEDCMIVFLVDQNVSKVTVWWDGRDSTVQTPFAYDRTKFVNDDPSGDILNNGVIELDFSNFSGGNGYVKSTTIVNPVESRTTFMRVNGETPTYGSELSYIIHHGVVRDIVQQEPEWSTGIAGCPNMYGHLVLTLPASANYYTYNIRALFVSSIQTRNINQYSTIQMKAFIGSTKTEDGQSGGKPVTSTLTLFYDGGTAHEHQWSEFIDASNRGAGIMYRDQNNDKLYEFDSFASIKTGSLYIDTSNKIIEFNPIYRFSVNGYQDDKDVTWSGAVVNFSSGNPVDSIYPAATSDIGLWLLVELPPSITIN